MDVVVLSAVERGMVELVGAKAVGLGALIRAGELVPDGFCVTTTACVQGRVPFRSVVDAYRRLGGGPVAVRSSATIFLSCRKQRTRTHLSKLDAHSS